MAKKVFTDESLATFVDEIKSYTDDAIDSHTHDTIHIPDTRNDNQTPAWYLENYPKQVVTEFKTTSAIGISGTGLNYCKLTTYVQWNHNSGAYPSQEAIVGGRIYTRQGLSDTEWGAWKTNIDSDNISSQSVASATTAAKLQTARTITLGTGASSDATSFNGSANITIPVTGVKESYLSWGGRNIVDGVTPLDMACSNVHSANRFAFCNAEGITIEYSTDGSTYSTYSLTDNYKIGLVSGVGATYHIGGRASGNTVNDKLRITFNGSKMNLYTALEKLLINVTTFYAKGSHVTIETATKAAETTYNTVGTYSVSGWSGWNSIPLKILLGGGHSYCIANLRLTFGITEVNSDYTQNGLAVHDIVAIGATYWTYPSPMAKTGHLYSYDASQNATFPAEVSATKFIGTVEGNADTADKLNTNAGSATNPVYFANGVPVKTTHTISKSVPSDAVFTDTKVTNTLATTTKAYLTGTTSASTNTGTQVFDTGVYLGTTAGSLYATKFNDYTLGAACAKGVTDSSSASAISTGTNLVTERDVYYGLPKINNSKSYTSSTSIYAPTAGGTSGYVLVGNGTTSAPIWKQSLPIANGGTGATTATGALTNLGLADSSGTLIVAEPVSESQTSGVIGFMSGSDKTKLDNIESGANNYSHPNYTAKSSGFYKVTVDSKGHVSGTTAVTKADITALGIPASDTNTNYYHTRKYSSGLQISTGTGVDNMYVPVATTSLYGVVKPAGVRTSTITATTGGTTSNRYYGVELDGSGKLLVNVPWTAYGVATTSVSGLMSSTDKTKLDGIATGANNYVLPTASSTLGGVKTTSTVTSTSGLTACPIISGVPYYKDTNTTYSVATTSANGLMSSTMLNNLNSHGTSISNLNANYNSLQSTVNDTVDEVTTLSSTVESLSNKTYTTSIATSTGTNKITLAHGGKYALTAGGTSYVFTMPSFPTATSSTLGGVKIGSNITVSSGTISLTKANVTSALGYTPPTTDTTYSVATTSANGLMSSTDKTKLNGIATGATKVETPDDLSMTVDISNWVGDGTLSDWIASVESSVETNSSNISSHTHSGAISTVQSSNLTANRALISNSSGKIAVSAVTSTELGYLDGVTSSIQTQLNGKLTSSSSLNSAKVTGTYGNLETWMGSTESALDNKMAQNPTISSVNVHRHETTTAGGWGTFGSVSDIYHRKLLLIIYDNNTAVYHYACVDIAFPNYGHHGNGEESDLASYSDMMAHSTCACIDGTYVWVEASIDNWDGSIGGVSLSSSGGADFDLESWHYI